MRRAATKTFIACGTVLSALTLSATILLDAPGHVCVDGRRTTASGGVPGASFAIVDWRGRPVEASGAFGTDGTAALPLLPVGYYHLKSEGGDTTFAVVPAPETRVFDHGSFYGVDSAQSWVSRPGSFRCPWNGGDTYRTVSDLLRLSGLPHVRERLSWSEVNSAPGKFDWRHYMYNADMLKERGLLVSGMFHDAPEWTRRLEKLPSDLAAVHCFCSRVATAFGDRMGDWEFWNEPDIGFAPEPVWDYAAAMKAAYLGFKAARPDMPVLPGALCQSPDSPYSIALLENDVAKFGDVFNYHVYTALSEYPTLISTLRSVLGRYGIDGRAIWVTESGTHMEGLSREDGAKKGMKAHTPEQELVLAEYYVKSQIALQMAGVSRNYFFVFGTYNEQDGAKDWGVMRRDGTVKPVYAAISAMTRELVSARLVGEIGVDEGLRAYLFEQLDGSQTVVFWSVSQLDTAPGGIVSAKPDCVRTLRLAAPDGNYRLTDTCGTRSVAVAKGGAIALESTRYPSYVSGFRGLKADVSALPCGKALPYVASADEDLSVVLRAEFDEKDFEISNQKTRAVLKGNSGRVRVVVWNLGETSKTGTVEVAGARLLGLPAKPFALGPRGSAPVVFDCTLAPDVGDPADTTLVLTGRFGGRRSSRLCASLIVERHNTSSYTPDISARPRLRGVMSGGGDMTEEDFKTLHAWGATLLRFQMVRDWHGVDGNRDLAEYDRWLEGRLDHFDKVVLPLAEKYGLLVALDLHVPPGGLDAGREGNMFYDAAYADHFVKLWGRIARRFRGRKGIYGYDLINEPCHKRDPLPGCDYWNLQRRAAEAVRAEDPHVPIIVESNQWATQGTFADLVPLALTNVIYEVHMYEPDDFTFQRLLGARMWTASYPDESKGWNRDGLAQRLKPVRDFQRRYGAKIYNGEFSAVAWAPGAENYLRDCISLFEEYGWDWSYHAFRESSAWDVEKEGGDAASMRPAATDTPRKRALLEGFRR